MHEGLKTILEQLYEQTPDIEALNRGKVYDGALEKSRKGAFPLSLLLAADTFFCIGKMAYFCA